MHEIVKNSLKASKLLRNRWRRTGKRKIKFLKWKINYLLVKYLIVDLYINI